MFDQFADKTPSGCLSLPHGRNVLEDALRNTSCGGAGPTRSTAAIASGGCFGSERTHIARQLLPSAAGREVNAVARAGCGGDNIATATGARSHFLGKGGARDKRHRADGGGCAWALCATTSAKFQVLFAKAPLVLSDERLRVGLDLSQLGDQGRSISGTDPRGGVVAVRSRAGC